jgi:hypothetical protein
MTYILIIYLEVYVMNKKKVYIVVKDGLVQDVFEDNGLDIEVVLCDLDSDEPEELAEIEAFVAQLPDFAKQVY